MDSSSMRRMVSIAEAADYFDNTGRRDLADMLDDILKRECPIPQAEIEHPISIPPTEIEKINNDVIETTRDEDFDIEFMVPNE